MEPEGIWEDFLTEVQKAPLPQDRFRPYHESLREALPSVLENLRPHILASIHHQNDPKYFTSENQVHFIYTIGTGTPGFCFSFLIENDQWYLQHIESIYVRLDLTGSPPVSTFPDLPEDTKAWCRDEAQMTEIARLYRFLSDEKGKAFALNWFRDGERYFLGARAWVPFVPPARAFILYACWEMSNLQKNYVTLLTLGENEAKIRARLRTFELYKRAVHLSQFISEAEYLELFETIWQDRAACAGWDLKITYEPEDCVFTFIKTSDSAEI